MRYLVTCHFVNAETSALALLVSADDRDAAEYRAEEYWAADNLSVDEFETREAGTEDEGKYTAI